MMKNLITILCLCLFWGSCSKESESEFVKLDYNLYYNESRNSLHILNVPFSTFDTLDKSHKNPDHWSWDWIDGQYKLDTINNMILKNCEYRQFDNSLDSTIWLSKWMTPCECEEVRIENFYDRLVLIEEESTLNKIFHPNLKSKIKSDDFYFPTIPINPNYNCGYKYIELVNHSNVDIVYVELELEYYSELSDDLLYTRTYIPKTFNHFKDNYMFLKNEFLTNRKGYTYFIDIRDIGGVSIDDKYNLNCYTKMFENRFGRDPSSIDYEINSNRSISIVGNWKHFDKYKDSSPYITYTYIPGEYEYMKISEIRYYTIKN